MNKIFKPHREKLFGHAPSIPLDRNAKVRIIHFTIAWNAKAKQPGQHHGPITRTSMDVLEALLWKFHNAKTGLCFPSYESIAEKAKCCRASVIRAINALEQAGILTWVNRIVRIRETSGSNVRDRIIRTSNSYVFRDPLHCAHSVYNSKSQNEPGTSNQEISLPMAALLAPLPEGLVRVLERLGHAIADQKELYQV